jgi:hypothetical protein
MNPDSTDLGSIVNRYRYVFLATLPGMQKTDSLSRLFGRNVRLAMEAGGKRPGPDNLRAVAKIGQGGAASILRGEGDVRLSTVEKIASALRVREPWMLLTPNFAPDKQPLSTEEKKQVDAIAASVQGMSAAQVTVLRNTIGKLLLTEPYPPEQMSPEWNANNHKEGKK